MYRKIQNKSLKWYRLFRTKHRFPRGKAHLVTVTFDEGEKAIYIDGQFRNKKDVDLNDRTHIVFSGSFLLGNSYRRKNIATKSLLCYKSLFILTGMKDIAMGQDI